MDTNHQPSGMDGADIDGNAQAHSRLNISNIDFNSVDDSELTTIYHPKQTQEDFTVKGGNADDHSEFKQLIREHLQKLEGNSTQSAKNEPKSVKDVLEQNLRRQHADQASKQFDLSGLVKQLDVADSEDNILLELGLSDAQAGIFLAQPMEDPVKINYDGNLGIMSISGSKGAVQAFVNALYFHANMSNLKHFWLDIKLTVAGEQNDAGWVPSTANAEGLEQATLLTSRVFMFYEKSSGFYVARTSGASVGTAQFEQETITVVTPQGESLDVSLQSLPTEQREILTAHSSSDAIDNDNDLLFNNEVSVAPPPIDPVDPITPLPPEPTDPDPPNIDLVEPITPTTPSTPSGPPAPVVAALTPSLVDDLSGLASDDIFSGVAADWHVGDSVYGAAGDDVLTITSGTVNLTIDAGNYNNIQEVETVNLPDAAHNITIDDDYFGRGNGVTNSTLTLNASSATNDVTIDGGTVASPNKLNITTGSGADNLTGGAGDDTINAGTGDDNIVAGAGDDEIAIDWSQTAAAITAPNAVSPANLVLWLDGTDLDGDGTSEGLAEAGLIGTSVTSWADKSGNGNNATQGASGAQPVLSIGGLNGKDILSFDGNDALVALDSASLDVSGNGLTIIMVLNPTSVNGFRYPINKESSYELAFDSGQQKAAIETNDPGGWAWGGTSAIAAGSPYVTGFIHDDTEWRFYLDGQLKQQITPANNEVGNITPSNKALTIGGRFEGATKNFLGDIGEILVYDSALSDNDREQIDAYLAEKWGLSSNASDSDTLIGDAGNDTIYGGLGVDCITGGADDDSFSFNTLFDSGIGIGNRDIITDFNNSTENDKIDLSAIPTVTFASVSTDNTAGNGVADFTSTAAAEVAWEQSGGNTVLYLDSDGDGGADMEIELTGLLSLSGGDFVF